MDGLHAYCRIIPKLSDLSYLVYHPYAILLINYQLSIINVQCSMFPTYDSRFTIRDSRLTTTTHDTYLTFTNESMLSIQQVKLFVDAEYLEL